MGLATKTAIHKRVLSIDVEMHFDTMREQAQKFEEDLQHSLDDLIMRLAEKNQVTHLITHNFTVRCR